MELIESYSTGKTQCPKCAETGADTRRDNLHLYSDGHSYCFACGYFSRESSLPRPKAEAEVSRPIIDFYIPDDATPDLPFEAVKWLSETCHLLHQDFIDNKMLWSHRYRWLIFPIENNGYTLGFQARNFNEIKLYKWYTKFNKKDLLKLYHSDSVPDYESLTLVEDIISGIRVGKLTTTAPLFGALISDALFMKIRKAGFQHLTIWLDYDKKKESLAYAQRARELGLRASCIHTSKDPKEHTNQELNSILGI